MHKGRRQQFAREVIVEASGKKTGIEVAFAQMHFVVALAEIEEQMRVGPPLDAAGSFIARAGIELSPFLTSCENDPLAEIARELQYWPVSSIGICGTVL